MATKDMNIENLAVECGATKQFVSFNRYEFEFTPKQLEAFVNTIIGEPLGYTDGHGNFEKSLKPWMKDEPKVEWVPVFTPFTTHELEMEDCPACGACGTIIYKPKPYDSEAKIKKLETELNKWRTWDPPFEELKKQAEDETLLGKHVYIKALEHYIKKLENK